MVKLTSGMNPREHIPGHRERGPKQYTYTQRDLAEGLDVSISTVRRHHPSTPESLARLVHRQRVRALSVPLTPEAIEKVIGEGKLPQWKRRWPAFHLWVCGGCQEAVLFSKGLCASCGGGTPSLAFDAEGYITVLVGSKYVPWHRLMLPTAPEVQHKDGNKWNNRPSNLVALGRGARGLDTRGEK